MRLAEKLKVRGQNSDDLIALPIKFDSAIYDVRISNKQPAPEGIAKQRHARATGPILLRKKTAAQIRLHRQNVKQIPRYSRPANLFGSIAPGQIKAVVGDSGDTLKGLALISDGVEF